jgi:GDPmannose 4,6-dehydratase
MHISCGILFNHEGEYRGEEFVTRKISQGVVNISKSKQDKIRLGTLEPQRDWGYAGDYVEALWMMLQHPTPVDFVIATGKAHSIEQLLEVAFSAADMGDWRKFVRQDQRFFRPAEVDLLIGDATKAKTKLGWQPKVGFETLIQMMVKNDLDYESKRRR